MYNIARYNSTYSYVKQLQLTHLGHSRHNVKHQNNFQDSANNSNEP